METSWKRYGKICLYILFICSTQNCSTWDADMHQWVAKFVNMVKMSFFPGPIAPKLTRVPYLIFWYMMYFSKIFNISENKKNCYERRLRLNLLKWCIFWYFLQGSRIWNQHCFFPDYIPIFSSLLFSFQCIFYPCFYQDTLLLFLKTEWNINNRELIWLN